MEAYDQIVYNMVRVCVHREIVRFVETRYAAEL